MQIYKETNYLTGVKTFNSVPDSFMINNTKEDVIVYPEPELYPDEYKILTSKKIITTPLSFMKSDIRNKKIGISISDVPEEDMERLGQDSNNLKCLSKILAQKIIRSEAIVVYGGDLRPNGFTQFLFEEARIAKFKRTDEKNLLRTLYHGLLNNGKRRNKEMECRAYWNMQIYKVCGSGICK